MKNKNRTKNNDLAPSTWHGWFLKCISITSSARKSWPVQQQPQQQQQWMSCCSLFETLIRFECNHQSVITATLPNNQRSDSQLHIIFNSNEIPTGISTIRILDVLTFKKIIICEWNILIYSMCLTNYCQVTCRLSPAPDILSYFVPFFGGMLKSAACSSSPSTNNRGSVSQVLDYNHRGTLDELFCHYIKCALIWNMTDKCNTSAQLIC